MSSTSSSFTQALVLPSRTERIKLAKSSEENDAAVAALGIHPEVRKHLGFLHKHFSPESARLGGEQRAADSSAQDFDVLKSEPDGKTRFIGIVSAFGLDDLHKSSEARIVLNPNILRSGVGSDALYTLFMYLFEDLKLHKIHLKTEYTNELMRGWLEKVVGASLKSEEKETVDPVDGGYYYIVGYVILESEWKERIKDVLESRLGL